MDNDNLQCLFKRSFLILKRKAIQGIFGDPAKANQLQDYRFQISLFQAYLTPFSVVFETTH
jgi:hypothetical protein